MVVRNKNFRILCSEIKSIESVAHYLLKGKVIPFVANSNVYWGEDWYKKVFPGGTLKK